MRPLLPPDGEEATLLSWAIKEGCDLGWLGTWDMVVDASKVLHPKVACTQVTSAAQLVKVELKAVLTGPLKKDLGVTARRLCTSCEGYMTSAQAEDLDRLDGERKYLRGVHDAATNMLVALQEVKDDPGPLSASAWSSLVVMESYLTGRFGRHHGKTGDGLPQGAPFDEYRSSMRVLAEVARSRRPQALLDALGVPDADLTGPVHYLTSCYSRPERKILPGMTSGLERAIVWYHSVHAAPLLVLGVPEGISSQVEHYTQTLDVGQLDDPAATIEVAAMLHADSQWGGTFASNVESMRAAVQIVEGRSLDVAHDPVELKDWEKELLGLL